MTSRIKKLAPEEAQKISAGEVVERPANIVKELIENSIDAGATHVTIYIEDGGKQLIRIVDNGYGMSEQDAQRCFEHHATSKLTSVNDLQTINTFGFRGEALSSIASVSNVTLITKQKEAAIGTQVTLEGSKNIEVTSAPCTVGTDITIRNLFYNVPARKKFLKTRDTEMRRIANLVHALCLNHINIDFSFFCDGKRLINCPIAHSLSARITQLKNSQYVTNLLPIETTETRGNIRITGMISNHYFFRYDRNSIFFFVNNRWIKNQHLSRALLRGYLNVTPPARFPAAYIFITLDSTDVDINIHPRKEEVTFLHSRTVENTLTQAVKKCLEDNLSAHIAPQPQQNFQPIFQAHSTSPITLENNVAHKTEQAFPTPQEFMSASPTNINRPTHTSTLSAPQTFLQPLVKQEIIIEEKKESTFKLLGQLNKTYIIIEKEEGMFVVDQHAAQERILYELFSKRFNDLPTIQLLFPQTITLTKDEISLVEPHLGIFKKSGIEVELFSETQLTVHATPIHIKHISFEELIRESISWIKEYHTLDSSDFFKAVNEKLHAQMACKAAVKAGNSLDEKQMIQLLNDLEKADNRFTCPHGRPTGWLLSTHDIEKKFKRKT